MSRKIILIKKAYDMKNIKVYFVYHKIEGIIPTLYGYTNNKQIINKFMEERNMSMFLIKTSHMTKDDYKYLNEARYEYMLEDRGYATYKYIGGILKKTTVCIVSTYNEEISAFIEADRISDEISKYTSYESRFFNHELTEALNNLLYFQFYKRKEEYDPFVAGVDKFDPNEEPFRIDSLGVFLYKYGHTLNNRK